MLKTFAAKYKCKTSKIREQYVRDKRFSVEYPTKSGMKTSYFYDDGFRWNKDIDVEDPETLPQYKVYTGNNTLAGRLKMGVCEYCEEKSDDIRMFQVKKLKDLKGDKPHERLMKEKRRKTLAVCRKCFNEICNA